MHGILLLDKPAGITSNDALQRIKTIYRAARAGHTGSLDKPATGMLPLCLGAATKIASYILNADKTYHVVAKLGVVTSTGDAAGSVLETRALPTLIQQNLQKLIAQFVGEIEQIPPMYSALKVDGQRLYKLAYQGLHVERKPRSVKIYQLDLLHFDHESLTMQVCCSKGTYIRSLVGDIGHALGCGAHVSTLRRLSSGPFNETQMVTLEFIERQAKQEQQADDTLDQLLVATDSALQHFAEVHIPEGYIELLHQGRSVPGSYISTQGMVRIYDHCCRFIGLGNIMADGRIAPKKILFNG